MAEQNSIEQWWDRYRTRRTDATEHVELFLRGYAPALGTHDHRVQFIERLTDAVTEDYVEAVDVTVVGKEICVCDDCRELHENQPVPETVERLKSWRDGGMKASGFTERDIHSEMTDERRTSVAPPELALGVYLDDSLVGVFPCTADGVTYTPTDFLEELTGDRFEPAADSSQRKLVQ